MAGGCPVPALAAGGPPSRRRPSRARSPTPSWRLRGRASCSSASGSRLPRLRPSAGFLALGPARSPRAVLFDGHDSSVYVVFYIWVGRRGVLLPAHAAASRCRSRSWPWPTRGCWPPAPAPPCLRAAGSVVVGATARARAAGGLPALRLVRLLDRPDGRGPHRRADRHPQPARLPGALRARSWPAAARDAPAAERAVGDLDGFKLVNDRLGHHAGDAALRRVARELEQVEAPSDVAARVGGEEFALLLPERARARRSQAGRPGAAGHPRGLRRRRACR